MGKDTFDFTKLLGGEMNQLMRQVEAMQNNNKEHVCIANMTFKKKDLKRAEPHTQPKEGGGTINCTKVIWVDEKEEPTILPVSIQQFNEEFYK